MLHDRTVRTTRTLFYGSVDSTQCDERVLLAAALSRSRTQVPVRPNHASLTSTWVICCGCNCSNTSDSSFTDLLRPDDAKNSRAPTAVMDVLRKTTMGNSSGECHPLHGGGLLYMLLLPFSVLKSLDCEVRINAVAWHGHQLQVTTCACNTDISACMRLARTPPPPQMHRF